MSAGFLEFSIFMFKEFSMSNQLKKWFSAGLAAAAAVLVTLAACDTGAGPSPEAGPGSGRTAGIRSLKVADVPAEIAAGKITVRVPYYEGFDPAALDVSAEVDEGAAVMPLLTGTQDFSRPKTFSVRSADGAVTKYTVTVYALFEGEAGLAKLAAYSDPERIGYAPEEEPLYIAVSGLNLDRKSAKPISEAAHGQFIDLDLSASYGIKLTGSVADILTDGPFSKVVNIVLPDTLLEIGSDVFNRGALKTIKLPKNLRKIGDYTFNACGNLASVDLPETLTSIGSHAFAMYTSHAGIKPARTTNAGFESIVLPEGLREIGSWAFGGRRLKSVRLPSTLTGLGSYAFYRCDFLEEADLSASKLSALKTGIFNDCEALASVKIPDTVYEIYDFIFENCKNLTEIDLSGTSLTTLQGANNFTGCQKLKTVYFPKTLISMELVRASDTFSNFPKNHDVNLVIEAESPISLWEPPTPPEDFPFIFYERVVLYVPDAIVPDYIAGEWGTTPYADKIRPISALGAAQ
jgi:hypothetical protein